MLAKHSSKSLKFARVHLGVALGHANQRRNRSVAWKHFEQQAMGDPVLSQSKRNNFLVFFPVALKTNREVMVPFIFLAWI
jgi:hypothetical protein